MYDSHTAQYWAQMADKAGRISTLAASHGDASVASHYKISRNRYRRFASLARKAERAAK